jgi:4-hydroxybenzoate polyprenyltransferase
MALLNHLDLATYVPLYASGVAWTIFYDTIYAHQDKDDDVNIGVRSTALLFGEQTKPILAGFGATFLAALSYAGCMNGQGLPFWLVSVGGAAAHLSWQLMDVNLSSRASCWSKFASNRDLGAIVWAGMMADYLLVESNVL